MAAAHDGHIADEDIAAELQRNGLVTGADAAALHVAGVFRVVLGQTVAIDGAASGDADVMLTFGPNERVVEIGMAAVLIFWATEHLAFIVGFHRGGSSQDARSWRQVKVHVALQTDAAAEIGARGQHHLTAALLGAGIDGTVDGLVVERLTVALGTVVAYIIYMLRHAAERG